MTTLAKNKNTIPIKYVIFISSLVQKVLQALPTRINFFAFTTTIYQITVAAAFRTETAAIFPTKYLLRQGEQNLLTNHFGKIDSTPDHERFVHVGHGQLGFGFSRLVGTVNKNVVKSDFDLSSQRFEATCAIHRNLSCDHSANMNAGLSGFVAVGFAIKSGITDDFAIAFEIDQCPRELSLHLLGRSSYTGEIDQHVKIIAAEGKVVIIAAEFVVSNARTYGLVNVLKAALG